MTNEKANRVLSRMGARELKQEEVARVAGGICSFTENNCTFVVTHVPTTDITHD